MLLRCPRSWLYYIQFVFQLPTEGRGVESDFMVIGVSATWPLRSSPSARDASSVLGWISLATHQSAAKTNSCWWFASCLRPPWPASRQQLGDPYCSEGGAEESSSPPTSYKTRGRRKHSDSKHTWSKAAKRERDEKETNREQARVKPLPGSSFYSPNWNRQL